MKRHPSEQRKRMLLTLGRRNAGPHFKPTTVLRRDRRAKDRRGDWDSQSGRSSLAFLAIPIIAYAGRR